MKTNKLFKTFLTVGLVATTLLTGCSSKSSSEPVKIGIPSLMPQMVEEGYCF